MQKPDGVELWRSWNVYFTDQNIMQRDLMELNFERLEMQNEIYQWIELKD